MSGRSTCAYCGHGFRSGEPRSTGTPCVTGEEFHSDCFDKAKADGWFHHEPAGARLANERHKVTGVYMIGGIT